MSGSTRLREYASNALMLLGIAVLAAALTGILAR